MKHMTYHSFLLTANRRRMNLKNELVIKLLKMMSKSVLVMIGMLFLYVAQVLQVQAEGGTFYHKHTESCYETVEIPCTEHSNHTETVSEMGYCPFCDRTTYMYAFINVETCPYTGESMITYATGVCQECGNIVYETPHVAFPAHTREVTNLICGKTEETKIATVSFSQSTVETTTKPVVLSINIEVVDEEFSLSDVLYSFDGGNTWEKNASKEFSENGTYTIACKDAYGTSFQETFLIDCIVKPTIAVAPNPPIESNPLEEATKQENLEEKTTSESQIKLEDKKLETNTSKEEKKTSDIGIEVREMVNSDARPDERGITMEGIQWSYLARRPTSYLLNFNENQVVEMERRENEIQEKEMQTIKETNIVYLLAPEYAYGIYIFACIFLVIAISTCLWYAYHSIVILYEIEDKERYFISLLFSTGKKERKVFVSEKNMKKIQTKEILLTCFYVKINRNMVVHTPLEKYRVKWGKEMHVHM